MTGTKEGEVRRQQLSVSDMIQNVARPPQSISMQASGPKMLVERLEEFRSTLREIRRDLENSCAFFLS